MAANAHERERAYEIVRAHGRDMLSFFKLRRDLDYVFSADGRAFAAYREHNGVMLLAGDPVGPEESIEPFLAEIDSHARGRKLRLGVLGAGEELIGPAEALGYKAIYIGDDSVVELDRFSLVGRPIRKVRQSVHRLERAGYRVEAVPIDSLGSEGLRELEELAYRWRGGAPDRGFSMTMDRLDGEFCADALAVVARDGDGRARAFMHCVPVYGRRPAMAMSLMPRDRHAPNGLTEYLIARGVERLRERGVRELSLYFAAFGRLLREPETRRDRLWGRLVHVGSRALQMETLVRFDRKFATRWTPRYVVYRGRLGIPLTGLAAMRAEGQFPPPMWRRLRNGYARNGSD